MSKIVTASPHRCYSLPGPRPLHSKPRPVARHPSPRLTHEDEDRRETRLLRREFLLIRMSEDWTGFALAGKERTRRDAAIWDFRSLPPSWK